MFKLQSVRYMALAAALSACALLGHAQEGAALEKSTPSVAAASASTSTGKASDEPAKVTASSPAPALTWVPALSIAAVVLIFFGGVFATASALKRSPDWNLSEVLSEKSPVALAVAVVTAVAEKQAGGAGVNQGAGDAVAPGAAVAQAAAAAPATVPTPALVGSSSRLIAFLGTIGLLAMFMGTGFYLLWAFFNGKGNEAKVAAETVGSYLLYGSSLFAPYAVNQMKAAFKA